ncbi:hypothetical protein HYH03_012487 [Edaphochlamys debaryana]|uniref:serine O-acetyltransferase n=1 Tax=Edaphochlamys debaryana TaxID=47281 RepID=A0A835XVE2_9CHLO|nr:hypothetical protein HYH03_012487 [Edaphochlamys debaryana]|eukprot:KAG2489051.1 hypothetical protein HYH03_012487 [Edaphochlamys debaryana]
MASCSLNAAVGTTKSARARAALCGRWPAGVRRCLRYTYTVRAESSEASSREPASSKSDYLNSDSVDWTGRGVPSYLQSTIDFNICNTESKALTLAQAGDLLWNAIRAEAQADAASEPLLSSFLYASILAHDSFELALAFVLANRLANSTMLPTQLFEIFHGVLMDDPDVRCAALSDMAACRERDPACTSYSHALLYYKGYHALQTQRVAHALWRRNQKVMALALQSRISEVFAVDIHPAARIGKGVLLDHGTGVVIGETAVVGNNVSILQNVTLGGTGKEIGDRHPKVDDNVLIGACATILGNITIGKGAQIAAGSLVLKPVPPHTLVAGSPAKEVGPVVGNPALSMVHWSKRLLSPDGVPGAVAQPAAVAAAVQPAAAVAEPQAAEPAQAPAAHASNGNGKAAAAVEGHEQAAAVAAAPAAAAAEGKEPAAAGAAAGKGRHDVGPGKGPAARRKSSDADTGFVDFGGL